MRAFDKTVLALAAAGAAVSGLGGGGGAAARAATAAVSGRANTGWISGNTGMGSNNLTLPNTPVATTGLAFTTNALPVLTYPPVGPGIAAAKSSANLPGGVLSLAAGVQGSTDWQKNNPGYTYGVLASGQSKFVDSVTVQSSVLPIDTPVRVHLLVAVAHAETVAHSSGLAGHLGTNSSHILSYVQGYVSSSWDSGGNNVIFSNDNKWFHESDDPSFTQLGLFAPGAQPVDIWLNTVVGRQLEISLELDTDNQGYFAPLNTSYPPLDVSGMTSFVGALAFGASVTDLNNQPINGSLAPAGLAVGDESFASGPPAVTLFSSYFGGAFPDASNATNAQAQSYLPASVVPEPATGVALLAFGAAGLVTRRRRPA